MLVVDTVRMYFPLLFTEVIPRQNDYVAGGKASPIALSPPKAKQGFIPAKASQGGAMNAVSGYFGRLSMQLGGMLKVQRMFNSKEQEEDGSMV